MTTKKVAVKAAKKRTPARRSRRTYSDIFLDKLKALSGDPPTLVNNRALREELNWDPDRYSRIKDQLLSEGLIISSRGGPGGSVSPVATNGQALKVFLSYSHVDTSLKDELLKHLKPLERMKLITSWNDRKLVPGDLWGDEISRNLEEADLVLLLVSIDFINSKYCYDIELDRALERHSEGKCKVIPIILRGCLWQHTPFAKLQALPRDAQPARTWPDLDAAMSNIADGIRVLAEQTLSSR
ncbi:toll/interleukin-1 receptor domain-containing protein [Acidovorax sp. 106]|uniref:toll/interleukin-1 receptor domain-containing protein n=1 Tax=Acidovorax sp. 106 TaxID=2135637 RepID=UPI000EB20D30|nr:toll/interleukin-1 receptor domain-containing protein [Acidovorax sp. 106]